MSDEPKNIYKSQKASCKLAKELLKDMNIYTIIKRPINAKIPVNSYFRSWNEN